MYVLLCVFMWKKRFDEAHIHEIVTWQNIHLVNFYLFKNSFYHIIMSMQ